MTSVAGLAVVAPVGVRVRCTAPGWVPRWGMAGTSGNPLLTGVTRWSARLTTLWLTSPAVLVWTLTSWLAGPSYNRMPNNVGGTSVVGDE